jgi:hypothetical protein
MIRIVLENDVAFDGNSFSLNQMGEHVLNILSPSITAVEQWIRSVQVQGHTADISAPGFGMNDWELSSLRGVSVVRHLENVEVERFLRGEWVDSRGMVASEKFIVEGFAQYSPAASNDTIEGRAANRRVEIIINRNDLTEEENRFVDDIMRHDFNNPIFDVDAVGNLLENPGTPIDTVVASIIGSLHERHGTREDPRPGFSYSGNQIGPNPGGFINITEDDFAPIDPNAPEPEPNGNGNGENGEAAE